MTKKMTKKEKCAQLMKNYPLTEEERLFVEHEIELLNKKSSGERKPTATQIANGGIKEIILEVLTGAEKPMTVSEIIKSHEELGELSNQKVSALMTQLKEEHKVVKTIEKRKSYFSIA